MKSMKELNRYRKSQANQQSGGMDAIDREAEAQGNATRFFTLHDVGPANLGRRISKTNRQLDGRRKTADKRATDNLVADTAECYRQLVRAA
jgi:hypothetical protein